MARVLTFLFADDIRREETGKLTAVGLHFDVRLKNINTDRVGKVIFVTVTEIPEGEHSVAVRFSISPYAVANTADGGTFMSGGEDDLCTLIIRVEDFLFPASGLYELDLLIDDAESAKQWISVKYDEEPDHPFGDGKTNDVAGSEDTAV